MGANPRLCGDDSSMCGDDSNMRGHDSNRFRNESKMTGGESTLRKDGSRPRLVTQQRQFFFQRGEIHVCFQDCPQGFDVFSIHMLD